MEENHQLLLGKPVVSVFESIVTTKKKSKGAVPLTPYQRYKLVKPYADQMAKDVNKELEENKETIQKVLSRFCTIRLN